MIDFLLVNALNIFLIIASVLIFSQTLKLKPPRKLSLPRVRYPLTLVGGMALGWGVTSLIMYFFK